MEPSKEIHYINDLQTLRVVADPLRLRILATLSDGPLNVKQVADRLGEKPTRLYYHVNALEEVGLVELVETRIRRSIVERYFLTVARDIRVDSRLLKTTGEPESDIALHSMLNTVLEATADDIELAVHHGIISVEDIDPDTSSTVFLTRNAFRFRSSQIPNLMDRLHGLMEEFAQAEVARGEEVYGLTIAFFPSFTASGDKEPGQAKAPTE